MANACLPVLPARRSGRRAVFGVALVAILVMLLGPVATSQATAGFPSCGSPVQTGSTVVVTCSYTDGLQSFTVPAGVTSVSIDVQGAAGGYSTFGAGGPGGDEGGTLAVSSGEVLTILAGGQGGSADSPQGSGGAGGYGGGAKGGSSSWGGGGGGGGSFVYDGSQTLVLAAGGGGGLGGDGCLATPMAGPGGGTNGGQAPCYDAGSGGTQSGGGTSPDGTGSPGTGPATWTSGAAVPGGGGTGYNGPAGGGGGGGGYYGGAGGGDEAGGGGSGFCAASLSGCYETTGAGSTGNGVVTITYNVPTAPAITSADSTTFTTGQSGTFGVSTTGYPAPSLSENGALPSGVTFTDNGNGTGTLSGIPAAGTGGNYPITITAANGVSPNASQGFILIVDQSPAVTSANVTTFTSGQSGTFGVSTTGFPTPSLSESGALPSGVTFTDNGDGTGTLSGTPAAGTGGTYPVTINAFNGVSPDASQTFTLTVDQAPAITSADATTFTSGQSGTFGVSTTGYPAPSLSESGKLPSGVKFTDNGNGTATLSGDPAPGTGGSYPITIKASNGTSPDASQSFTLTVRALTLSGLKVSPARFTAAGHGPAIIQSGKRGARISYQDSMSAKTTFRVYRKKARRWMLVGSFTHSDTAGANAFRFSGRLHRRALPAGRYRLKATATLNGLISQPETALFRVRSTG